MTIESLPFDLREVMDEVVELLLPSAQAKGLSLILDYPGELPGYFVGDPGRIRQVAINLVGNAIKFTGEGRVLARVDRVTKEGLPADVRVLVEDTGIGISHTHQKRIFEKFSQCDSSTTRKFGGTGLGLTISKRLVELMNGSIGVHSELGKGSTFWFSLPLTPDNAPRAASLPAKMSALPHFANLQLRVLVAEDNIVNQRVAVMMLKRLGVWADVAADGQEAVELWAKLPYDLTSWTVKCPGWMATRRLRKSESVKVQATTCRSLP